MVLLKYLKPLHSHAILAALMCGGLSVASFAGAASAADPAPPCNPSICISIGHAPLADTELAQSDSDSGDQPEVPPDQVEKYIAVYRATQSNHSLTVEQAAAQQGLTVTQFRELEGRIERNDALRERVRKALRGNREVTKP
jgi:hypothetical protein